MKKKYKIGYTTGVFDLFHIGHLNIINNSKSMCEHLIVGVTTDDLVSYKNTKSFIPENERLEIVSNLKAVDRAVYQDNMDKMKAWEKYRFDVMFVGSDWKGTEKWNNIEKKFKGIGVDIVYFEYTKGTSSTKLKKILNSEISKFESRTIEDEFE